MPSLGAPEIIIILVIALLVFGPRRLPEMGRSLGRAVREFKKASDTARKEFGVNEIEREIKDVKSTLGSVKGDLKIDVDAEVAKPPVGETAAATAATAAAASVTAGEPDTREAGGEPAAAGAAADAAAAGDGAADVGGAADLGGAGDEDAPGDDEVLVGEVVDDEEPAAVSDAAPSGA